MDYIYLVVATVALGLQSVTNAYYQRFAKNASPFFFTLLLSATMGVFTFLLTGASSFGTVKPLFTARLSRLRGFRAIFAPIKRLKRAKFR